MSNVIFTQERVCWQMVRKSVKDSIINHQRGGGRYSFALATSVFSIWIFVFPFVATGFVFGS